MAKQIINNDDFPLVKEECLNILKEYKVKGTEKKDYESAPCATNNSEMKDAYVKPKLKKPSITFARRLNESLWSEFYDEYLRAKERENQIPPTEFVTEYITEFGRESTPNSAVVREELIDKYPLYATAAISVWNPTGDSTRNFKKVTTISKPTAECDKQFG